MQLTTGVRVLCVVALVIGGCGSKKDDASDKPAQKAQPSSTDNTTAADDSKITPEVQTKPKPEPDEKPVSPDEYRKELVRGAKLAGKKKYAEAVEAFERALRARPDDPRANSELSWAAFKTGDMKTARAAANASVKHTKNPILKAASLYNVGRVEEREGNKELAIAAYSESLELRDHRVVRKRLLDLGGKPPNNKNAPTFLAGPFASLDEFCKRQQAATKCTPKDTATDYEEALEKAWNNNPSPRWKDITIFRWMDDDAYGYYEALAIQTEAGWFVRGKWDESHNRRDITVSEMVFKHGRLVMRYKTSEGRFENEYDNLITVCGIGVSNKVSCTPGISLEFTNQTISGNPKSDEGYDMHWDAAYKLKAELTSADVLVIKARNRKSRSARDVGQHTLTFR